MVFADDVAPATQSPETAPAEISTPPAETTSTDTKPADQTATTDDAAALSPKKTATPDAAKVATAQSAVSNPNQPTDNPQLSVDSKSKLQPQVDNTTGALKYSYPITVPPGRNGLTPSLSLQYNSQNTANDSVVGYGWNLSIPYIQTENKHGVDQLYTGTYKDYTTSDNGELGQISGGTYQLKSDDGSFSKYTLASNIWTVTTKSGTTYSYGATAASRQDDPSDATHIYKWMLDKVTDTNGNSISYTYFKDQGQIYPDTITYTNTTAGTGPFSVVFTRANATNVTSSGYASGFNVTTQYIISNISAKISGVVKHSYDLGYGNRDNTTGQVLSTITESGTNPDGATVAYAPVKFTYTYSSGKSFSGSTLTMPTHDLGNGTRQGARIGDSGDAAAVWWMSKTGTLSDVNGDGYPDWVETEDAGYQNGSSTNGKFYDVWLGSATGWVLNTAWTNAMPKDSTGGQYALSDGQNNRLVDINGDGLPDWVISTSGPTINGDTSAVYLNTGTGWSKSTTWTMPTYTVSGTTYGVAIGPSTPNIRGTFNPIGPANYTYYTTLIDVNNDGLPDMVQSSGDNFGTSTTSDHHAVYLNTGTGWVKSTTWTMPYNVNGSNYYGTVYNPSYGRTTISDINGDGLPDWVQTNYNTRTNGEYSIWLNSGTGWVKSTTWNLPVHTNTPPANTDIEQGIPLTSTNVICNYGIGNSYYCAQRVNSLADVNGDGLPDFIETYTNLNASSMSFSEYDDVWLNNGKNGWVKSSTWTMPMYASSLPNPSPIRLGNDGVYSSQLSDVNNDGLLDIVASCDCGITNNSYTPQHSTVFINSGSGWINGNWALPTRSDDYPYDGSVLGFTDPGYGVYPTYPVHRTTVLQDINKDGSLDWIESNQFDSPVPTTPNPTTHERHKIWTNSAKQADLLSKVTYPKGGFTTIAYAPQIIVDKNPGGQIQTIETVTSIATTAYDNSGTSQSTPSSNPTYATTYSYQNGKYFYNTNKTWRKFAGFQKVTITNPDSSKIVNYYHQGDGIDTASSEYSDAESEIGKLYRTDISLIFGAYLYKRITTKWDKTLIQSTNSDVYFVYPTQTLTEDLDGDATEKGVMEAWVYNTSTGNLSTYTNYGEVIPTSPISATDVGTDRSVTTYTYASNASGMYAVSDENTVDQTSARVRETRHYYDSAALGTITLGNETKTEKWKWSSTYVNSQKSYNSYGLPATSTDERGKVTTYTYDANNLYPATVTDPLTHSTQYTYDYMYGKVLQTTDQNGYIWISKLDGLGRPLSEQMPDPVTGVTSPRIQYSYNDQIVGTSYWSKSIITNSGISSDDYFYTDGLGRTTQERKQTDPNGTWSNYQTVDTLYDSMGRIGKQTVPYNSYGPLYYPGDVPATTSPLYTAYNYDVEGRISSIVNSIGTTSYVYDNWMVTVTDPKSQVKKYYYDGYKNLVKVDEINGSPTYTYVTNYTWNLNKDLIKITDALGNIRNFTYDGLGHRLSAEDLHASGDTTFGLWSYSYDDAGNLTQYTAPKSAATINYTYDNGERKLTEDYSGIAGTEITYIYDSCTKGIGKLCTVTIASGANTAYTYDYDGNVASENKTINGTAYLTSYTYDRAGDITTITYPDNAIVQYSYMSDGIVSSIQRKESGGSFVSVVSGLSYSPDLQISSMQFGNGVTTTNNYDSSKMYRLASTVTQNSGGTNFQNIAYTYDADNNITNIANTSANDSVKNLAYTYDGLSRIGGASATATYNGTNYTETYIYDAIGNITTRNIFTSYLYQGNTGTSYANPHAVTSIGGVAVTYDNDGNMLTNGTLTNTWNYKDQLATTAYTGATVSYAYDHDGNRVSYTYNGSTTVYPNKYYNVLGTTKEKEVYLGNRLVATIQTVGTVVTPYYIHTDNTLGVNVVTDSTGALNQLTDNLAFGAVRLNEQATAFNSKFKFGGHMNDNSTALMNFGARYYNPKAQRFISEDPSFLAIGNNLQIQALTGQSLTQVLMNPQSLNSYSYALNNPIVNTDPNGNWTKKDTQMAAMYLSDNSSLWKTAIDHPIAAGTVVGVVGGATALGISYLSGAGLIVDTLSTGQLISNESVQAIQARNLIQGNLENVKVSNLIKSIFKPQDTTGGGTIEALQREINSGELTGGKSHITKGIETVNRISNIQNTESLNSAEQKGVQTISNIIQKLLNNAKK